MRVRVCLINYNTFEATDELAQNLKTQLIILVPYQNYDLINV